MATPAQWLEGARPRTLPNAIAPVIAGTGAAGYLGEAVWWKALLALVVSLSLILGVNFANDYSDGIRGTDDDRVGPLRLVGSGLASPEAVKRAAFVCFGVAGVAGVILSLTSAWWLILVGLVCVAGAWFYTGGTNPYGYQGLGEIAVFVFFGLVAVLGTEFVQAGRIDVTGVLSACAIGSYSSAVLVANNLRDIPTDTESGKITLAVRLGDSNTRILFGVLVAVPTALGLALAAVATPWALLTLLSAPLAVRAALPVVRGGRGPALIPALAQTGLAMLVWSIADAAGLFLGA
ncbi:1,4-dihydroxy-2-naphthoate octaprenyltransferase OS=Tsukamurella paurometabola (strain ATCC 8368 /DSM / CCUG 35730 / CIP 100753 / JCM 10117 / KCTC 9821/ NBRC 16120 / NCIMB 702349 / NCTC 13040) OX=521096 GN=menA PE=3 SV=1 [Tsukamurella paurometabola]|uniref:1,4-dihydroxy-2-naphthoate octaprenyltransferase n=1 Tax=Tsukamurella paurometabola (strain ATCC 8368 / DSM 20162 / CCUG 35730 / CIP 100753 / JCM 10117 / KCTC 9821 / NBRC 16120 / NCIMB 702349 / NCTC 13040) TaxID=521096 RepID=D5UT51_TSUPD|nr:1,4-dihydroxy-2-naphthoate polyprenyltransferase [Tsukamurella paurometabola]ADG77338.1 1,4-dihydroxy-2-naphthoateoctaprenyltransferase [Tsukamurella paurometabola DSM 20162]SUP43532.1 1,4-dihydroxy-2-naphthoate octaprenyltransferase [Tsukamurella paurometabola]